MTGFLFIVAVIGIGVCCYLLGKMDGYGDAWREMGKRDGDSSGGQK